MALKGKHFVVTCLALALSGCMMTPTNETVANYAVYDMKDPQNRSPDEVGDTYLAALKTIMSDVSVTRNIPPQELPDKPGRFELVNPLQGSSLGALAAANGASMNVPNCAGAYIIVASDDTGMSRWGENTRYYNCLWQYKDGWHIDWYISYSKKSGGVSADAMASALVESVMGDSRKAMKVYRDNIIKKMNDKGFTTQLIESYPKQ